MIAGLLLENLPSWMLQTLVIATVGAALSKIGSAQESVEARILGCFPEDNKFGLGGRHPLRFQQEVAEVLIAPSAP